MSEIDALAGEYALGLLDPVENGEVERRAEREPALAAAIAAWRDRLLELDASAAPATLPQDLWARISGALDAPAAQSAPAPAERRSRLAGWWADLALWRGAALAGAAASVVLAFVALTAYQASLRQPQVIAVLLTGEAKPGAVVEVFADGSSYVAPLVDVAVPSDRIMQVWTLPDRQTGPVSLGLLSESGSALLQPASLPAPKPQQLYEITMEPAGGSPTGRPTGPILFKGYAERPR